MNGFHRGDNDPLVNLEAWALSQGGIQEKLIIHEDMYDYIVRTQFTFTATQTPPTYFL